MTKNKKKKKNKRKKRRKRKMSRRKRRRVRVEISGRWEEEKDEGIKRRGKRRTGPLHDARHSMTSSVGIRNYTVVICPNSSP
jgi:hypothetical protein